MISPNLNHPTLKGLLHWWHVFPNGLRVRELVEKRGSGGTFKNLTVDDVIRDVDGNWAVNFPLTHAYRVDVGGSISSLDIANQFTIFARINAGASADTQAIICAEGNGSDRNFQFRLDADGELRLIRFDSSGTVIANFATTGENLEGAGPVSVAGTFSTGNGSALYIAGREVATDGATTANNTNVNLMAIGENTRGFNDPFGGTISNVMIFSRRMNQKEIEWLGIETERGYPTLLNRQPIIAKAPAAAGSTIPVFWHHYRQLHAMGA